MNINAAKITMLFLLLIALAHVCRLIWQVEVVVNGVQLPQWLSLFGVAVPAGLAMLLQRESRG